MKKPDNTLAGAPFNQVSYRSTKVVLPYLPPEPEVLARVLLVEELLQRVPADVVRQELLKGVLPQLQTARGYVARTGMD